MCRHQIDESLLGNDADVHSAPSYIFSGHLLSNPVCFNPSGIDCATRAGGNFPEKTQGKKKESTAPLSTAIMKQNGIARVAPVERANIIQMFNDNITDTTIPSPEPPLLVNISDDRRKFVFELTTDKHALSFKYSKRATAAANIQPDVIVDCTIKQHCTRFLHAKKKGHHKSIWDCWLVVKKGNSDYISLTALDYFHASCASPKETVRSIISAQNAYLRPKYMQRQRKGKITYHWDTQQLAFDESISFPFLDFFAFFHFFVFLFFFCSSYLTSADI